MAFEKLLDELTEKKNKALQQGGPERVKRQHDRGLLTARERIERLLDPGTFVEFGLLACSDMPGMEDRTPADGLITGYGLINGRQIGLINYRTGNDKKWNEKISLITAKRNYKKDSE